MMANLIGDSFSRVMVQMHAIKEDKLDTNVIVDVTILSKTPDTTEIMIRPIAPYSGDAFVMHAQTWFKKMRHPVTGEELLTQDIDYTTYLLLVRIMEWIVGSRPQVNDTLRIEFSMTEQG